MGLEPLRPSNLIRVMPAKEVRSDVLPHIHCITESRSAWTLPSLPSRRLWTRASAILVVTRELREEVQRKISNYVTRGD